jgi:hypothetical protein
VPSSIDVCAVLVTLPSGRGNHWRFTEPQVDQWHAWYGIDFSPLAQLPTPAPVPIAVSSVALHQWTALAEPVTCFSQDLGAIVDASFVTRRTVVATTAGRIDAVALYFDAVLAPGVTLTTDPRVPRDDNHWRHRLWLLPDPVEVAPGDAIEVTFRRQMNEPDVEVKRVDG